MKEAWIYIYCDKSWKKNGNLDQLKENIEDIIEEQNKQDKVKIVAEGAGRVGKLKLHRLVVGPIPSRWRWDVEWLLGSSWTNSSEGLRRFYNVVRTYDISSNTISLQPDQIVYRTTEKKPKCIWTEEDKKRSEENKKLRETDVKDLIVLGQPYVQKTFQTLDRQYDIFIVHTALPNDKYQVLRIRINKWNSGKVESTFSQHRWSAGRIKNHCTKWNPRDLTFLSQHGSPSEWIREALEEQCSWWTNAYNAFNSRSQDDKEGNSED